LKPHPTITQRIVANPRLVGRVTPCAPRLACKRTSFLQPPPSQCFTLKKQIMQVPVFTTCYVRIQSAQDARPRRHWLPSPLNGPSMGRGIEGEGWSYPEPPPVRFFLYQPHPGVPAEHLTLNTENCPQTPGKPITVIGTAAIRDAFVVGGFQKKSELF